MDRPDTQRLALIELHERDGRIGRVVDVWRWPLTLGRAMDNDVVIDDPHVAAHHATLQPDEHGALRLLPLASRNGVAVNGRRGDEPSVLPAGGAELQLGTTRLRLRLPGEVLAPELPLPPGGGGLRKPLLLGLLAFALLLVQHWIALDPGADYNAWLPTLVGVPAVLAGWCAAWALMSKLFQHRFDFNGHLRIVLPWLLGMTALEMLWPQLTAALATRWLWMLGAPLQALLGALLVRAHLEHVLPAHRKAVNLSLAALVVAGGGLSLAATWRATQSLSPSPYMSTLPPPALRLAGTVPSATLVQEMAPLAERLNERAKKSRQDDEGDSDSDSDE